MNLTASLVKPMAGRRIVTGAAWLLGNEPAAEGRASFFPEPQRRLFIGIGRKRLIKRCPVHAFHYSIEPEFGMRCNRRKFTAKFAKDAKG
jgi:hypothetical protein